MTYNVDFQITLNKLTNSKETFSDNLKLAFFSYRMEETYSSFSVEHQSAVCIRILTPLDMVTELEDED